MSKKILALLLAMVLIIAVTVLVSCTGGNDNTDETSADAEVTTKVDDVTTKVDETTVSGGDETTVSGGDETTVSGGDETTVSGGDETTVSGGDETTPAETEPQETEPADGIYESDHEKAQLVQLSFDECDVWNGENKLGAFFTPGQATTLPEMNDVDGHATDVRFWGWLAVGPENAQYGYKIDDLAPVFNDDFYFPGDDVLGVLGGLPAGSAFLSRFNIYADITELASGEHTIKALYKLDDGTMVCVAKANINIGYRTAKLDATEMSFVGLAENETDGTALDVTSLKDFFTVELPLGQAAMGNGLYNLGGISDMYVTMDGEYMFSVKVPFMERTVGDCGIFVRGYKVIHSPDLPAAKDGMFPINNYYETDGLGGAGGSGILVALKDGKLVVFINAYNPENLSKVKKVPFEFDVTGIEGYETITFVDKSNVVYIYAGTQLVTTVTLSGWTQYADVETVGNNNIYFAEKAVVIDAQGNEQAVENTLVVDNAASDIGVVGRASIVRFPTIAVSAPIALVDKAADANFKHVSPDDIRADVDGNTISIYAWGWVALTKEFETFGYQIDNDLPYYNDEWIYPAEEGVVNAAASVGASVSSRFKIQADLTNLSYGKHTIHYLVKYTDGTVVCFAEKTAYVLRPVTPADAEEAQTAHISFDQLYAGTDDPNSGDAVNAFTPGQYDAWEKVATIEKGSFTEIYAWGWVGTKAPLDLNGFGYIIDGSVNRVFDPAFAFATEQAVIDAAATFGAVEGGASRFKIKIDISALDTGNHEIVVVYTLADGTIVELGKFTVKVTAPIEGPQLVIDSKLAAGLPMVPGFAKNNAEITAGDGTFTLTSTGGDPWILVAGVLKDAHPKFAALRYKATTDNPRAEFFIGSGAGPTGGADELHFEYVADGNWHTIILDLTTVSAYDAAKGVNYFRYDFFEGEGTVEIEYLAFFGALQDAEEYTKTIVASSSDDVGGRWLNNNADHTGELPVGGAKAWFSGWIGTTESFENYKIGMYVKGTDVKVELNFADCAYDGPDAANVQAAAAANGASYSTRFLIEEPFPMLDLAAGTYTVVGYISNGNGQILELGEYELVKEETVVAHSFDSEGGRWLNVDGRTGETPEGGAKAWFTGWIGTTETLDNYKIGMFVAGTKVVVELDLTDCLENTEQGVIDAATAQGAEYATRYVIEECFPMADLADGEYTVIGYIRSADGTEAFAIGEVTLVKGN